MINDSEPAKDASLNVGIQPLYRVCNKSLLCVFPRNGKRAHLLRRRAEGRQAEGMGPGLAGEKTAFLLRCKMSKSLPWG